jgi:hypothetical protein
MLRLGYSAMLLAAIGCSPVKDNSNVPDAAIDAMDTRPPMIAGSYPADMGTKVSVLSPISVFFDEPLDPTSVSAATVKLGYKPLVLPFVLGGAIIFNDGAVSSSGLIPVRGTVSYDAASRKISFIPVAPLAYGVEHVLTITAKDSAGLPFMGTLRFLTYVNQQTRTYNFFGQNNSPSSWQGFGVDMNGRATKRTGGSQPGSDAVYFTMDDPRNQHVDLAFHADGRVIDERTYSPGTDGLYDTPDDVLNQCWQYKYDANKLLVEKTYPSAPGPDTMWCTMDDIMVYNYVFEYNASSPKGYVWYTEDGPDNAWRTTDDRCTYYYEYEYDTQGLKTREVLHTCATDGLLRTADDSYAQYYVYQYDANGDVTRYDLFVGPGPDTMWLTSDDPIGRVVRYQRNADGQITESIDAYGAGPDTMWGTNDDPGSRTVYTYDAKKLLEETTLSSIGADNMWNTADDVISNYNKYTYDANGNRIDQKQYNFGGDQIWKNMDDRITVDYDFDAGR